MLTSPVQDPSDIVEPSEPNLFHADPSDSQQLSSADLDGSLLFLLSNHEK
jgi:hypothetical protein